MIQKKKTIVFRFKLILLLFLTIHFEICCTKLCVHCFFNKKKKLYIIKIYNRSQNIAFLLTGTFKERESFCYFCGMCTNIPHFKPQRIKYLVLSV